MIRASAFLVMLAALTACGGPNDAGSSATRIAAAGGTCPDADPVRDGPLVDAIRLSDAAGVRARLAADPGDARAQAALALITGQGRPDADQAACFAPYL